MIRSILALWMILSALGTSLPPETRTVLAMKTGILLRMHVVAPDDTPRMQQMKLCVRDAVRKAYAGADASGTMLQRANALMPHLTRAAQFSAAQAGFTGSVSVAVEHVYFDARTLDGLTIPAGEYPALMIRLGAAQGRNWWGLIDPDLALDCLHPREGGAWTWSLREFLRGLFGWEVSGHE